MKSNHWKLYPALLVIIFGSLASVTVRGQSNVPELPRTRLDTTYVPPSGNLIAVASGANLQAAVDAANPGDTILLQAGASFIGNFTLPNKAAAAWIIIRSSAADAQLPPPGSRALPAFSSLMPKLISANAAPVLSCAAGAHHFRFIGVEFAMAAGSTLNYGLVNFSAASQTALEQVPHDLIVDRCYLHGNNTGDVSRGVALNSARTAIIDSTISNIHGLGFDTQAICGWNGPGPFKITNNYLEAAGENLLFGGADPAIVGLVPSDIELQGNTLTKPLAWNPANPAYVGTHWSVKNLLELKNAERVLVNGNDFSNCWVDGQVGIAILLTPRNQQGTAPWSVVQDITFSNNAVRHAAGGLNITGTDDLYSSQPTQRVAIRNNLFEDINGAAWGSGDGRLLMFTGISNLTIDHNTGFASGDFACVYGQPTSHLVFSNNVVANGNYGFFGDNVGIGNPALNTYCPAALFAKNAIIGAQAAGSAPSNYPANNYFPVDNNAVQFSDWANKNYQLAATSPYKNAALDGKDVGADLVALLAALGQTGTAAPGNQPPTVSISASVGSGVAPLVVSFACVAADGDGQVVAYHWDFGDGQAATAPVTSHLYQAAGSYTAQITVTDNLGATASASVSINVSVAQPGLAVSSVIANTGGTAGGSRVTISGANFAPGATVSFGGTGATHVAVNSTTSISARTPTHAAGAVNVVVTNPNGQSATLANGFTYIAPSQTVLTLSAVSPNSSLTAGGTSVTITGTGFITGASVSFGGVAATTVNVISSTLLIVKSPAHAAGMVNVVVTNPDSQSATLPKAFSYLTKHTKGRLQ